jgi:Tfp pilus assembly protein PilV
MKLPLARANRRLGNAGFTLAEILVSFLVFSLMVSGLCYGYVQANRMAEWSSMSLAAQSYAEQGLEQMRSAQWNAEQWPPTNGPGTDDELPMVNGLYKTNQTDTLDVPTSGAPIYITNYITVFTVTNIYNTPLREIVSQCVWTFPLDGILCTNTAITMRAPDE